MDRHFWRTLGSLWLLGFAGEKVEDDFLRLLDKCRARNLILFRDNLPEGPASLAPLRKRLEEAAGGPMALFVDEEGGWIQQIEPRSWPSARALGLAGASDTGHFHVLLGSRMAALGVDVVLGPVADVMGDSDNPVIGTRSFGDAATASECVRAAVESLTDTGVLSVLKHFPGHGDSLEDSHLTLPTVRGDRRCAMPPFRAGIAAGGEAVAVMTAHLRVDDGASDLPATFRGDLIREYLPDQTGFDGLVMTDALEMGGAAVVPPEDRGLLAFKAGCHLLTLARWEPGAEAMLAGMHGPLLRREIPLSMVDEALERRERWFAAKGERAEEPVPVDEHFFKMVAQAAIWTVPCDAALHWDGTAIEIEFGATGSWRREEFLTALAGLPVHELDADQPIGAANWLWVGRDDPSASRLRELRGLSRRAPRPLLLDCGCHRWAHEYGHSIFGTDTSPRGLRAFLDLVRRV